LAGTGFGRQLLYPELLIVPGLCNRSIGLVASRRTVALVFVINSGRGLQKLLKIHSPLQRCRPPAVQNIENIFRDVYPAFGTDLLLYQIHRKHRGKHIRRDRFAIRPKRRQQRCRQIRRQIIPLSRNITFFQLDFLFHCLFSKIYHFNTENTGKAEYSLTRAIRQINLGSFFSRVGAKLNAHLFWVPVKFVDGFFTLLMVFVTITYPTFYSTSRSSSENKSARMNTNANPTLPVYAHILYSATALLVFPAATTGTRGVATDFG